jgi:pyridinium-3,5-biscarboxylic acid mononucleotide sulfurtransferase
MSILKNLKDYIKQYQSSVIAFSGGVDSTFLSKIVSDIPTMRTVLVTVQSAFIPQFELETARTLGQLFGLEHRIITIDILHSELIAKNSPERCYYCKYRLFSEIKAIAHQEGCEVVFDGTNAGDSDDYRPGMKALRELGVVSPLFAVGMTKNDIRSLSAQFNLSTATMPSYACLASRIPYNEVITPEKIQRVERAESSLRGFGFTQFRVRYHGGLAKIEFIAEEIENAWKMRDKINKCCKDAGFVYVAIDIDGYRTGALNEMLPDPSP